MTRVAHRLSDTAPDAEEVLVRLLRSASTSRRLRLALSLSRTTMSLARAGLARAHPGASPEEIALRFVALNYGADLAEEVRRHLARSRGPADEPVVERRS